MDIVNYKLINQEKKVSLKYTEREIHFKWKLKELYWKKWEIYFKCKKIQKII